MTRRETVFADKTAMQASNTIYDIVSLKKEEIFLTAYFGDLVELLESCIDDRKIVPILRSQRNAELVESRLNWPAPLEQAVGARERTIMAARARAALAAKNSGRKASGPIALAAAAAVKFQRVSRVSPLNGTNRPSASTRSRSISRRISAAKSTREVRTEVDELPSIASTSLGSRLRSKTQEHCKPPQLQMKFSGKSSRFTGNSSRSSGNSTFQQGTRSLDH